MEAGRRLFFQSFGTPANKIDAFQAEIWCGSEEVAVIRIDFFEAMFRRASKVEGVGRTEECRRRCGLESPLQAGLDFIGERTPHKMRRMLFLFELVQSEQILLCIEPTLAVSTMQRSDGFCLGMPCRSQGRSFSGKLSDRLKTVVFQIKSNQVTGIKV